MYNVAFVTGNTRDIAFILKETIDSINSNKGSIDQVVQSQSQNSAGYTIVVITIIYRT